MDKYLSDVSNSLKQGDVLSSLLFKFVSRIHHWKGPRKSKANLSILYRTQQILHYVEDDNICDENIISRRERINYVKH